MARFKGSHPAFPSTAQRAVWGPGDTLTAGAGEGGVTSPLEKEQEPQCTRAQVTSRPRDSEDGAEVLCKQVRPLEPKLGSNVDTASFAPRAGEASDNPAMARITLSLQQQMNPPPAF